MVTRRSAIAAKGYLTDLTEGEWARLEPLLPPVRTGRPGQYDRRAVISAILYALRSGCSWRLLPRDLPPWQSVYYYFRKWRDDGTWDRITLELYEIKHGR